MYQIADHVFLLVYCLLSLALIPQNDFFIIAFLFSLFAASSMYALDRRDIRFCLLLPYGALSWFVPEFLLFLPLIAYDLPPLLKERKLTSFLPPLLPAASFVYHAGRRTFPAGNMQGNTGVLLFVLTGCCISLLLQHKTHCLEALRLDYLRTRDDDTEIQLLLQEKNRSLQEKQDYEIYAATLRERNRIAREIHDNVGHMLTRSILMVGALKAVYKTNGQPEAPKASDMLTSSLDQLETTLSSAMDSIRSSVHDLHDSSVNLQDSLESLIRHFTFCPVKLHYQMSPETPQNVKYCFIAIAKEALANMARHSNATAAKLSVLEHPGFYQMIIHDNGTTAAGQIFSLQESGESSSFGMGLSNMQNRVLGLGGIFRIHTENGFCIYITIPRKELRP